MGMNSQHQQQQQPSSQKVQPVGHAVTHSPPNVGLHAYMTGIHHGMMHGLQLGHAAAMEQMSGGARQQGLGTVQAPSNIPTNQGAR